MSAGVQGKIAIVTGGAQGIGKSIAETFAREGATVVLSDVKTEQARATAAELGATFVQCDVSDFDQVHALVDACVARYGRLDIMVNNAGINSNRPEDRVTADRYPIETWHK
ncbi:MAG: SDR family NAD(P)-dependent oxidoreductase, partial [Candidatus Hydrogenedentes bacterium]|nr:SDR family NAD(P)-dependent oxidoreductase [Candidatus Hydrogenedentota bacterium]